MTHTKTPWRVRRDEYPLNFGRFIVSSEGHEFLYLSAGNNDGLTDSVEEDEANAEFIVRACNSHEALVEACSDAVEYLRGNLHNFDILEILEAALDAAKG